MPKCHAIHELLTSRYQTKALSTKREVSDAWIGCLFLAWSFCVFRALDHVFWSINAHTHTHPSRYPTVLTKQAWSTKELSSGLKTLSFMWDTAGNFNHWVNKVPEVVTQPRSLTTCRCGGSFFIIDSSDRRSWRSDSEASSKRQDRQKAGAFYILTIKSITKYFESILIMNEVFVIPRIIKFEVLVNIG